MGSRGGRRPGAGRKKGSKNKATVASEAVAQVIEVETPEEIAAEKTRLARSFLHVLEEIATDPTAPRLERIAASKVGLSYLPPPSSDPADGRSALSEEIVQRLNEGRQRVAQMKLEYEAEQRSDVQTAVEATESATSSVPADEQRADVDEISDVEDAEWSGAIVVQPVSRNSPDPDSPFSPRGKGR